MKAYRVVLLAIVFAFISTSIAFADEMTAWSQDHSYRVGLLDAATDKGVRGNLPDHIAFRDHSFREGVLIPDRGWNQSTESNSGVRGYYPESDMRQELGITDEGRRLLLDGPAD